MSLSSSDPRPVRFAYSDTRRWVMIGAGIGVATYTSLAVVNVAVWGWAQARHPLVLILAAVLCGIGLLVAARGHVFAGGVLGFAAAWGEVHYSILTSRDFPTPSLAATSALLVAASLLFKPKHSMLVAVVSIGLAWPMVMLSPAVQATGATPHVFYWLTAHASISIAVWSLVSMGFSTVDRAFTQVLRKERALAEAINKAPDGILVLDADARVQVANPAAQMMLGVSERECVGRPIAEVLRQADPLGDVTSMPSATNTDEKPRGWLLHRADGRPVEIELTWRSMDAGRRQLVLRDVSERSQAERARREMEVQLAHSQRLEAVGQLAGGIAHDFNNILTIVGASAEVLRAELTDDRYAPLLDEVLAAQERGATLTRQLLAFARREVVQPTVFDLSAQVLTLRRLLQRVAGEQTRISCDVEPDCRIRADVGQVEQALVNLVSNARDAMPDGGTCRVSVVRMTNDDGGLWVRLRVRDEGVGMDAATQARAFEPFFTTKPRGRGTGLGLAAVHGMVMQSGGRADIESAPGKGACVILEFPFVADVASPRMPEPLTVRAGDGATILVAEDDDGTRATVARMLGRLGHTVLLAPDGQQALRMAEQHGATLDLLLTDVMMPGMSGPQLAAQLRRRGLALPVLYMSGYPEDALSEAEGLQLETDFLAKPFTSALLARKVADKLGLALTTPQGA